MSKQFISDQITPELTDKVIFEFETPITITKEALQELHRLARKLLKLQESIPHNKYRITFRHQRKSTQPDLWKDISVGDVHKDSQ